MSNNTTAKLLGERFGVHESTIRYWAKHYGFPKPATVAKPGSHKPDLWDLDEVRKWEARFDDKVNMRQTAEWLGVTTGQLRGWAKQKPLPDPDLVHGTTYYWHWTKIQDWASDFIEWEEN